jgi:hypothetical protein
MRKSGVLSRPANFNAAVNGAMNTWNQYLNRSRFVAVNGAAGRGGDGNLVNEVFFDSNYYGTPFGRDTLAITTRWMLNDVQRVEADIVFNSAFSWDSYSGSIRSNGVRDIRRVALHELGHALGLDHPDERGQSVVAMMNSVIGNLDTLTDDDIRSVVGVSREEPSAAAAEHVDPFDTPSTPPQAVMHETGYGHGV